MVIAKRFATGKKGCMFQTDSAPDGPHQWHTCAGIGLANATFALEEWPHRRYICAGTVLRVAFLASFGALPLDCVTVHVTRAFRRNINQRRRGWFTIPSPTYIAAMTAPPPFSDSTGTGVRRYLSGCPCERAERGIVLSSHVTIRHGTPAAKHHESCFPSPQLNILNVLPGRNSCRILSSAVGEQSTPLATPAEPVPIQPKKSPMGQPDGWMRFQKPP
jgi:hypothetical protein